MTLDEMIQQVMDGASPEAVLEGATRTEVGMGAIRCSAALKQAGCQLVAVEPMSTGDRGEAAVWKSGNQTIRLFTDGTFRAFEGGRELMNIGDAQCSEIVGFPEVAFL